MDIQRLKLVGWILSLLICLVMLGGLGLLKLSRPDQEISAGWIASLLIFATVAVAATTEIESAPSDDAHLQARSNTLLGPWASTSTWSSEMEAREVAIRTHRTPEGSL